MNRKLLLRDDRRVFADDVRVLGLGPSPAAIKASPLTRKIGEQNGVDLAQIKTSIGRIEKAGVPASREVRAGRQSVGVEGRPVLPGRESAGWDAPSLVTVTSDQRPRLR